MFIAWEFSMTMVDKRISAACGKDLPNLALSSWMKRLQQ